MFEFLKFFFQSRYQVGEFVIVDRNRNGIYDKDSDTLEMAHSAPSRENISAAKRALKETYGIDLNSERKFPLSRTRDYVGQMQRLNHESRGPLLEMIGLRERTKIKNLADEVGAENHDARFRSDAARSLRRAIGEKLSMREWNSLTDVDGDIRDAKQCAEILRDQFAEPFFIPPERIVAFRKEAIAFRLNQSKSANNTHYVEWNVRESESFAKRNGIDFSVFARQICEARRQVVENQLNNLHDQAYRTHDVPAIEKSLQDILSYARSHGIVKPGDVEVQSRLILRTAYLKSIQRDIFSGALSNPDCKLGDYLKLTGYSLEEALFRALLLDAKHAAATGDIGKTRELLQLAKSSQGFKLSSGKSTRIELESIDRDSVKNCIETGFATALTDLHLGKMDRFRASLEAVEKYLEAGGMASGSGMDSAAARKLVKQIWTNRDRLVEIEKKFREADRLALDRTVEEVKAKLAEAAKLAKLGGLDFSILHKGRSEAILKKALQPRPGPIIFE